MDKKSLIALIIWAVLAALNIVSVFVVCKFLIWTNVLFACFNFTILVALVDYFITGLIKKKKEDKDV